MDDVSILEKRVMDIFHDTLNLVPPDKDTDLFSEGGLDSLLFVDLLVRLEQEFSVDIPLEKLVLEDFNSISSIARTIQLMQKEWGQSESPSLSGQYT